MKLFNAISLNMFPPNGIMAWRRIPEPSRRELLTMHNCIGHRQLADLLQLPFARVTVQLQPGEKAIVCQYIGERLQEGATMLPPGSRLEWIEIEISTTGILQQN